MTPDKQILVLKKDQKIVSSLLAYCEKHQIKSAWIWGLGAIQRAELSAYDLENKKYLDQTFDAEMEIANLSGNVGQMDGKPISHLHIVLTDKNMVAFGGHLKEATVAATCEIMILPLDQEINRRFDPEIGLNLINNN